MTTSFSAFVHDIIAELRMERRFGTAQLYASTLRSVDAFRPATDFGPDQIDVHFLKDYEFFLRDRGCSWNTVSTYMRVIRAVYHRALAAGTATYRPRLFARVYTGTEADRKRALNRQQLGALFNARPAQAPLKHARDLCRLMFLLRGIPFADLVFLRKNDLQGNVLRYRRRKTGTRMEVRVNAEAQRLIARYAGRNNRSPYLFPFVRSAEGTPQAYREYRSALRLFNTRLRQLGQLLKLDIPLSSYTIRHSWATLAYHLEVHPGIISQAMGHSSITVTETYLKPFLSERIEQANRKLIKAIGNIRSIQTPRLYNKKVVYDELTL